MLLAACVCADYYEILPKDPKTGSLKLLSATSCLVRRKGRDLCCNGQQQRHHGDADDSGDAGSRDEMELHGLMERLCDRIGASIQIAQEWPQQEGGAGKKKKMRERHGLKMCWDFCEPAGRTPAKPSFLREFSSLAQLTCPLPPFSIRP